MALADLYLSLGSNLGNRKENLHHAIAQLPAIGVAVHKVSSFYETEPVDYLQQPWFLNLVVQGETDVPALPLLRSLRQIETQLGSTKAFAKGPRLLDIDILLYADQSIDTPELQVPHPRMLLRKFVLIPLAELAPDLHHPSWPAALTVQKALQQCPDPSLVKPFAPGHLG